MKFIKLGIVILLSVMANASCGQVNKEAFIKQTIAPRMGDNVKIDSVLKTPYAGLYEVRVNGDVFYTDEHAQYIFFGHVMDAKTKRDFTKERIDELSKVKFSDLPLNLALKKVKGNGQRTIAVFEDPNCGYCKHFRHTLQEVDNLTVYTFMYNILAPDSAVKSRNVWCSSNPAQAWDDWMIDGKQAPAAPESCQAPNDKVLALGQRLKITGTPTIFFTDGSRVPGAIDAKALEQKLSSIK